MKTCTECEKTKPLDQFYKKAAARDGLQHRCKDCADKYAKAYYAENKSKQVDRRKKWNEKNRKSIARRKSEHYAKNKSMYSLRSRKWYLRSKYGLTIEEFAAMVEAVGGVCEICGQPPRGGPKNQNPILRVDHDHKTGQVRGLLCDPCNRSIGLIGDENLAAAAAYIERANKTDTQTRTLSAARFKELL